MIPTNHTDLKQTLWRFSAALKVREMEENEAAETKHADLSFQWLLFTADFQM